MEVGRAKLKTPVARRSPGEQGGRGGREAGSEREVKAVVLSHLCSEPSLGGSGHPYVLYRPWLGPQHGALSRQGSGALWDTSLKSQVEDRDDPAKEAGVPGGLEGRKGAPGCRETQGKGGAGSLEGHGCT